MWLTKAGGIKVFTDVRSGKLMGAAGLEALLVYAGDGDSAFVLIQISCRLCGKWD